MSLIYVSKIIEIIIIVGTYQDKGFIFIIFFSPRIFVRKN